MASGPDPRWIRERLARLAIDDPAAHAELMGLYPETVGRLGLPWDELTEVQQQARVMLDEELQEAAG